MQAEINSVDTQNALRVLTKLAAPSSGNINIEIDDGIVLSTSNNVNSCKVKLEVKTKGKASFGVPLESFTQAVKNHKELSLKYKDTLLHIKSGAYHTELSTVDFIEFQLPDVEVSKVKIDKDKLKWLKSSVSKVALRTNTIVSSFMPCGIKLGKSAYVSCFDVTHLAFTQSNEISGDMEFVLPLDTVQSVFDTFESGLTLGISKSHVLVKNKHVEASISIPDVEENMPSLAEVIAQSKQSLETKSKKVKIDAQDLLNFLDNAKAVATKERTELLAECSDNSLTLEVRTIIGNVKTRLSCESKSSISFKIDLDYFEEMLRKMKGEVVLSIVQDAFLLCRNDSLTSVIALNQ